MEQHKSLISTKADTLFALRSLSHTSTIEEMYILHVRDYQMDKLDVCHQNMDQFRGLRFVVRSSASAEDSFQRSNAGHYKSILDVDSSSEQEIIDAETEYQILYSEAKKAGYKLSADDKKEVQKEVSKALKGLSFTQKLRLNISKSKLSKRFEKRKLADNYKNDQTKELDKTVDEIAGIKDNTIEEL